MDTLIQACRDDSPIAIDLYLQQDGNVNVQNEEGTSLLHFAVDSNAITILRRLLLIQEIDINALDDSGMTPLDYALVNGSGFEDVATLLRQHGAREGFKLA